MEKVEHLFIPIHCSGNSIKQTRIINDDEKKRLLVVWGRGGGGRRGGQLIIEKKDLHLIGQWLCEHVLTCFSGMLRVSWLQVMKSFVGMLRCNRLIQFFPFEWGNQLNQLWNMIVIFSGESILISNRQKHTFSIFVPPFFGNHFCPTNQLQFFIPLSIIFF